MTKYNLFRILATALLTCCAVLAIHNKANFLIIPAAFVLHLCLNKEAEELERVHHQEIDTRAQDIARQLWNASQTERDHFLENLSPRESLAVRRAVLELALEQMRGTIPRQNLLEEEFFKRVK